jgi:hypothetical protein
VEVQEVPLDHRDEPRVVVVRGFPQALPPAEARAGVVRLGWT